MGEVRFQKAVVSFDRQGALTAALDGSVWAVPLELNADADAGWLVGVWVAFAEDGRPLAASNVSLDAARVVAGMVAGAGAGRA